MFLVEFLKNLLDFFYFSVGHYGIAIVLLSLTVTIIMLPLFWLADKLQSKDRCKKERMEAELAEIKGVKNRQERYFYTRRIYQIHHYHPVFSLVGLVGLAIQVPFFMAAYQMLGDYEDFAGTAFLNIMDLAKPDGLLKIAGISVNILPFIMAMANLMAGYFYSNIVDRKERRQLLFISLLFFGLLYGQPAALVLYWTFNNLFAIPKNWLLDRLNGRKWVKPNIDLVPYVHNWANKLTKTNRISSCLIWIIALFIGSSVLLFLLENDSYSGMANRLLKTAIGLLYLGNIYLSVLLLREARAVLNDSLGQMKMKNFLITLGISLFSVLAWAGMLMWTFFWVFRVGGVETLGSILRTKKMIIFSGGLLFGLNLFITQIKSVRRVFIQQLDLKPYRWTLNDIAIPFMFVIINLIITPINIYYSSPDDFRGDLEQLIIHLITYIIVLSLIYIVFFGIVKKLRIFVSKLMLSSILCSIVFGYIYQKNLSIMRSFRFVNESLLNITPQVLLLDLLIIIFLFYITFKLYTKYIKAIHIFLVVIVIVLSANLVSKINYYNNLYSESAPRLISKESNQSVSKESELDLSQKLAFSKTEPNVLVIISDAFPAFLLNDIFATNKQYETSFDGFTWYRNTVSIGNFTLWGVSGLVGGHKYTIAEMNKTTNKTYEEKIANVWISYNQYLTDMGYQTTYGYTPYFSFNERFLNKQTKILSGTELTEYWRRNPPQYANNHARDSFNNTPGYLLPLKKDLVNYMSIFKIAPYTLKKYIYNKIIDFSVKEQKLIYELRNIKSRYRETEAVYSGLARLANGRAPQATAKFLWTTSTIRPFHMNKEGTGPPIDEILAGTYDVGSNEAGVIQIHYNFGQLSRLFTKMKEENVYDNTVIILASDHGSNRYGKTWNEGAIYALLMVKEPKARGKLKISNKLMSNADIFAITTEIISGESADIIASPLNRDIDRSLYYWVGQHGNWDSLKGNTLEIDYGIEIKTDVYDKGSWRKISYEEYLKDN